MQRPVEIRIRAHPRAISFSIAALTLLLQAGSAAAAGMVTYGGP
ncbi:DUF7503 family protein [Halegenticoccus tardaugens]